MRTGSDCCVWDAVLPPGQRACSGDRDGHGTQAGQVSSGSPVGSAPSPGQRTESGWGGARNIMGPGRALWVFLAFPSPCHMSPVEGQVLPRTRCCGPVIQTSLTAPTLARRPHPVALDSWDQLDTGLIHLEAFHLTLIWNSLGQWNFPRTGGRGSMGPGMQAGEPAAEGAPFCCTRACSSRSGVARRARGALQQTWADDAALSVWQEKGDGIRDGARLIDTRQRHQPLSMRHTRRPRASPCARVCPKPRAAGDEAGPGPAPAGGVWAPGPEEPGAELRCATYQRGGPGQVPFWASRTSSAACEGPACGCTWKGLGFSTPSGCVARGIVLSPLSSFL